MVSLVSGNTKIVPYRKLMALGRRFDYSKFEPFLDYIFADDYDKLPVKTIDYHVTTSRFKMVKSNQDVRDVLDVSGKLSLQIMAGTVDIKGEGEYLKETASSTGFVEVLAKITFQTVTKTIIGTPKLKVNWNRNPNHGKHYVRSITYGGYLIASLKFEAKNTKDKELVEANVQAKVKSAGSFNVDVKGQFKKLAEAVSDISSLSISYMDTAEINTIPTDLDSLLKAIENFPNTVTKNGVPIEAEIVPLSELEPKNEKLKFLQNNAAEMSLNILSSEFFDIITTRKALKSSRGSSLANNWIKFEKRVDKAYAAFGDTIFAIDLEKDESQFQKAFDAYKGEGSSLPGKFMREFENLIKNKEIQRYVAMSPPDPLAFEKNGVLYLGANNSYTPVLQADKVEPELKNAEMEVKNIKNELSGANFFSVYIKSVGCDDPGKESNTCGFAYIQINGVEYARKTRGHNIVVVDPKTGKVVTSRSFDTHYAENSVALKNFLNSDIPKEKIVLVCIQDNGDKLDDEAIASIAKIGGHNILKEYRSSYVLIGWSGPGALANSVQVQKPRTLGPSIISTLMPFEY